MKKISVLLAIGLSLLAKDGLTIGIGGVAIAEPYKGVDGKVLVLPFIEARYNNLYVRGSEVGYEQKNGDTGFAIFSKARLDGYEASDSAELSGMKDRGYALDGGVKLFYESLDLGKLTAGAVVDMSSMHKGYEITSEYSKSHFFANSIFIPFVGVKYQDKKLSSYYFGVQDSEATPGRNAYAINHAINYEIGARYIYNINSKSTIFATALYTILDNKIKNSPIVENGGYAKGAIFYGYRF